MNLLQKTISLLFFLGVPVIVSAQNIYDLDLETSILLAKEQSKKMLILRKRLEKGRIVYNGRLIYDLAAVGDPVCNIKFGMMRRKINSRSLRLP